jgi:hypothetical protein
VFSDTKMLLDRHRWMHCRQLQVHNQGWGDGLLISCKKTNLVHVFEQENTGARAHSEHSMLFGCHKPCHAVFLPYLQAGT